MTALRHDPLFHVWRAMVARCTNPKHAKWKWYGARGIGVCERWLSFDNFKADMGERPEGMTLERVDNNLGYGPDNCCWANWHAQAQSRRSHATAMMEYQGERLSASEWARRTGIPQSTLCMRLKRGWSHERALTTPIGNPRVPLRRSKKSLNAAN